MESSQLTRLATGASSRRCASHSRKGNKGPNQDSLVVLEPFMGDEQCILGAVFDGHGDYGLEISSLVRDILPNTLASRFQSQKMQTNSMEADVPETFRHLAKRALRRAFKQMEEELVGHQGLDCSSSGCTAVLALIQGDEMVVANLGDSRCIIGIEREGEEGFLEAEQITEDLKPGLLRERRRIEACQGVVSALPTEPTVERLWHPSGESPGLAMSRCFGDTMLKPYGLIAEPQLFHRQLTKEDQFLVLASDGIWDVLDNHEVVHIAGTTFPTTKAAIALTKKAATLWKERRMGSKMDDISVVIMNLKERSTSDENPRNGIHQPKWLRRFSCHSGDFTL